MTRRKRHGRMPESDVLDSPFSVGYISYFPM